MQINRQLFQQQLELLQKCSSTSINEDISDKVIFYEFGMINISRGRLVTGLMCEFGFKGMFPIDNLLKIVKGMSGEDITLELIDEELKISSNKSKLGLKPLTIENIETRIENALTCIEKKEFTPLPGNFLEGLRAVLQCVSNDKTLSILSNVAVLTDHLSASDNMRIGDYRLSEKFPSDFLIDNYNVQPILDFNPESYFLSGDRIVFFKNDDFQICAINIAKYPDFTSVIKRKPDMSIVLPEEIKESVYLAQQIPGRNDDRNMQIILSKNKIALSCKTTSGWFKKNLRIDYADNPITFSMNLNVLCDVLSGIGNEIQICNSGIGIIKTERFKYAFPIKIEEV